METLKELVQFMAPSQRLDLKAVAMTHVLSLTGTEEGIAAILELEELMHAVLNLTKDSTQTIAKDAIFGLLNLTAKEAGAIKVYEASKTICPPFSIPQAAVKEILDEDSSLADPWLKLLCNLSRVETLVHDILNEIDCDEGKTISKLAKAFTKTGYNKKQQELHFLGPLFCNLTQVSKGRDVCLFKYDLLDKFLPFTSYENVIRRGGTIGILKNICFYSEYHDRILEDSDDFLCAILKPLCGPEEFTDEENEKFPIELQYLPETQEREADPDLRKMLLECLLQLCATKKYREHLRQKGVYEILREYHKWESRMGRDKDCLLACENVVDILIKKEEEIGLDNYKEVEVPEDVAEKFVKDDSEYLKDLL